MALRVALAKLSTVGKTLREKNKFEKSSAARLTPDLLI